jgi:hypothetical protein
MINQYLAKWVASTIEIDSIDFNTYGKPFYFKLVNEIKSRDVNTRAMNTSYTLQIRTENTSYPFKEEDRIIFKNKIYTITNVDEQPNKLKFGTFIKVITAVR